MTKKIRLLDDKTINKIAAGEVVEKPSSVVKELIENSIDANSSTIVIDIKEGGKKYLRVTDNGNGISKDELKLAFLRHSTSKINTSEDLQNIHSLGFRGEALASITAVSQLQLITKTSDSLSGQQIEVHGGNIIRNFEVGSPKGTTVIVRNLFYNTPVRLNFLKSDTIEASYISEIIYKLALAYPNISFKYIKDEKVVLKTPGKNDLNSTVYSLFGKKFTDSLFKINHNGDDIKIRGFASNPSFNRGNRSHQYFFVNGRFINSKLISKAIEDAYKTLIPINRFPVVILYICIDPKKVDVNVHPTKVEIRFENSTEITNKIFNVTRSILREHNLIPEVTINEKPTKQRDNVEQKSFIDNIINENNKPVIESKNIVIIEDKEPETTYQQDNFHTNGDKILVNEDNKDGISNLSSKVEFFYNNNSELEYKANRVPELKFIGRLFKTYLLAENIHNDTFYLIDQHAAHERIMYEKFKAQYETENIISQNLLVPEVINLTHSEHEIVSENYEIFRNLGFEFEEFGSTSIILRSVPLLFGKPNSKKLFLDILDAIDEELKSSYELRLEKIMKMACTNAIKGGDNIEDIEVEKLIKDLNKIPNPYTCPHGRPIMIKMSRYELEKKFKRVQ